MASSDSPSSSVPLEKNVKRSIADLELSEDVDAEMGFKKHKKENDSLLSENKESEAPPRAISAVNDSDGLKDLQERLHCNLNAELIQLAQVLKLPENVSVLAHSCLKYVMNNHHIDAESETSLQAFQISLCWIAASLLKHKLQRKQSLALAKQRLMFRCRKEEAECVYSRLRCLKRVFLCINSPEAASQDFTADHFTASNPDNACVLFQDLTTSQGFYDDAVLSQQDLAEKDVSNSIAGIKKKFLRKKEKLSKKQEEEIQKHDQHSEAEMAHLEEWKRTEATVNHRGEWLDKEYTEKLGQLELQRERERKILEERHLIAKNKLHERENYWIDELKSWAQTDLINKPVSREIVDNRGNLKLAEPSEDKNKTAKNAKSISDRLGAELNGTGRCNDGVSNVSSSSGDEVDQDVLNAPEIVSVSGRKDEDGSSGVEKNVVCAVVSSYCTEDGMLVTEGESTSTSLLGVAPHNEDQNGSTQVEAANSHPQDDSNHVNGGTQGRLDGHQTNNSDRSVAELVYDQIVFSHQTDAQHTTCYLQQADEIPSPKSNMCVSETNTEPLENELERIKKESEEAITLYEEKKRRLNVECEKEISEIRRKYDAKLEEIESEFIMQKKVLDANHEIVLVNKILAETLRDMNSKSPTSFVTRPDSQSMSCSDLLRSFGAPTIPPPLPSNVDDVSVGGEDEEEEEEFSEHDYEVDVAYEDESEDAEDEYFDNNNSDDDALDVSVGAEDDLYEQFVQSQNREIDHSAYHSMNIDEMVNDLSMKDVDDEPWHPEIEFKVGMTFPSRDHVKSAVKLYSIRRKREFRLEESRHNTYAVRCNITDDCDWRLRATQKKNSSVWTITRYTFPHSCFFTSDRVGRRNLDSELMSHYVSALVEKQPNIQIAALKNYLTECFGVEPSYKTVWKAKQKAIKKQFGNWEESFNLVCPFIGAATFFNGSSSWDVEVDDIWMNNTVVPNVKMFARLFCSYKPCIEAFKHCRPVLCINGTFTYGKYKICLLTAEAIDGDDKIFPVAFALVQKENNHSWEYFMNLLRFAVVDEHPTPMDVCIISDRHKGILNAMQLPLWKHNPHRFCIRHIARNFNSHFKNEHLKNIVERLGREPQKKKWSTTMKRLRSQNEPVYDWLRRLDKKKWALAHDGGHRHGVMTTNFAESYNAMLMRLRALPVAAMMKMLLQQLVDLFNKNRSRVDDAINSGDLYTEACMRILQKRVEKAHGHQVTNYDRINGVMSITTTFNNTTRKGKNVQVVKLKEVFCTCGKFQQSKIPCSHAIAGCMHNNIDYTQFISPYFTLSENKEVWTSCFVPIPDETYWPAMTFPKIVPNPEWKRKKGRPQSTRIRNEMDGGGRDVGYFCSKCGKAGHNRNTCPRNNR